MLSLHPKAQILAGNLSDLKTLIHKEKSRVASSLLIIHNRRSGIYCVPSSHEVPTIHFRGQRDRCHCVLADEEEEFRHVKDKIHIRGETDADVSAIAEVTVAAFKTLAISNHTE